MDQETFGECAGEDAVINKGGTITVNKGNGGRKNGGEKDESKTGEKGVGKEGSDGEEVAENVVLIVCATQWDADHLVAEGDVMLPGEATLENLGCIGIASHTPPPPFLSRTLSHTNGTALHAHQDVVPPMLPAASDTVHSESFVVGGNADGGTGTGTGGGADTADTSSATVTPENSGGTIESLDSFSSSDEGISHPTAPLPTPALVAEGITAVEAPPTTTPAAATATSPTSPASPSVPTPSSMAATDTTEIVPADTPPAETTSLKTANMDAHAATSLKEEATTTSSLERARSMEADSLVVVCEEDMKEEEGDEGGTVVEAVEGMVSQTIPLMSVVYLLNYDQPNLIYHL